MADNEGAQPQQKTNAKPHVSASNPHVVKKADVHVRRPGSSISKDESKEPSKSLSPLSGAASRPDDGREKQQVRAQGADEKSTAVKSAAEDAPDQAKTPNADDSPAEEEADAKKSAPTKREVPTKRKAIGKGLFSRKEKPVEEGASDGDAADGPDGEGESAADTAQEEREQPREPARKRRIWPRVLVGVVAVCVAVAVAFGVLFAWDRWLRYDDAADIQGEWYAAGTTVPLSITDKDIVFDADTSYAYSIDPQAKTIRYTLADLEGEGRYYWFDDGHRVLVIMDGAGFTAMDTALEDAGRALERMRANLFGEEIARPEGDGVIVLTREPDAAALEAERRAAEEAEAAERRAAEEAEAAARAEAEAARAAEEAAQSGAAGESPPPEREFANESVGIIE